MRCAARRARDGDCVSARGRTHRRRRVPATAATYGLKHKETQQDGKGQRACDPLAARAGKPQKNHGQHQREQQNWGPFWAQPEPAQRERRGHGPAGCGVHGNRGAAASGGKSIGINLTSRIGRRSRQGARQVDRRGKTILRRNRDRVGKRGALAGVDGLAGYACRSEGEIRRRSKGEIQDAHAAKGDRIGIRRAEGTHHDEVRSAACHRHIQQLRCNDDSYADNSVVASNRREAARRARPDRENRVEITAEGVEAGEAARCGLELIPNRVGPPV